MGIPRGDEERGKIKIDGQVYGILGHTSMIGDFECPLINDEVTQKIYKVGQKYDCTFPMFFSRENYINYLWEVKEEKLYLQEVSFSYCEEHSYSNMIEEIFGEDSVFAQWFSGEIKVIVRSVEVGGEREYLFDRDVINVRVKEGVVVKKQAGHEVARGIGRKLKNYIEE